MISRRLPCKCLNCKLTQATAISICFRSFCLKSSPHLRLLKLRSTNVGGKIILFTSKSDTNHLVQNKVRLFFFLRVPHQGVIAPPKLERTFSLGLDFGEMVHTSPPLQLARLDFGSSFYMPHISGLIPNSGNTQTVIQCGTSVAFLNIASVTVEEMRVLTVRAKYIFCNRTSLNLQVLSYCRYIVIFCLAV
jgi:hypothetical protein